MGMAGAVVAVVRRAGCVGVGGARGPDRKGVRRIRVRVCVWMFNTI